MLGLPSEKVRVALTSDGVMAESSKNVWRKKARCRTLSRARSARRPDGLDDSTHLGPIEMRRRLLAAEEEVEQVVVGELHQQREAERFGLADRLAAREETLQQQIVLEQAAAAAPAQLAERARIDRT